jgi:hypothetical protein
MIAAQVSRMLRDKGVADLVVAARHLQLKGVTVHIKLVGDADRHNPSSISERQLRRWTDEHVVEWTGFRSDIVELWRSTHIAVLASYREGLPKSLLEAGASGRAIVATDVPGNRELVIPTARPASLCRQASPRRWPPPSSGWCVTLRCAPGWVPPRGGVSNANLPTRTSSAPRCRSTAASPARIGPNATMRTRNPCNVRNSGLRRLPRPGGGAAAHCRAHGPRACPSRAG